MTRRGSPIFWFFVYFSIIFSQVDLLLFDTPSSHVVRLRVNRPPVAPGLLTDNQNNLEETAAGLLRSRNCLVIGY